MLNTTYLNSNLDNLLVKKSVSKTFNGMENFNYWVLWLTCGQSGTTAQYLYNLLKINITDAEIKNGTGLDKNKILRIDTISPLLTNGGGGFSICIHNLLNTTDGIVVYLLVRNLGNMSDIPSSFTFTFSMLNN